MKWRRATAAAATHSMRGPPLSPEARASAPLECARIGAPEARARVSVFTKLPCRAGRLSSRATIMAAGRSGLAGAPGHCAT